MSVPRRGEEGRVVEGAALSEKGLALREALDFGRRGRDRGARRGQGKGLAKGRFEFLTSHVTPAQWDLQHRARRLAADFATRAAQHDREASDPVENYAALRDAGFYGLNVPAELGGGGVGVLGWSLAAEELAQGCASTALSFNMHLSVVGPMMESRLVPRATKERLASWWSTRASSSVAISPSPRRRPGRHPVPLTRSRRVDGGYRITGRKAFASMIAVADYVMVMARPDEAASPTAAIFLLVRPDAPGRRVDLVWDTLGMRATRSDSMTLEDCFVSDEALLVETDDVVPFRRDGANSFWASYRRLPGHRGRRVSRDQRDREGPHAARLHTITRLSSRRPAAGGRDECRPGGRAAVDAPSRPGSAIRRARRRRRCPRSIGPSTSWAKRSRVSRGRR